MTFEVGEGGGNVRRDVRVGFGLGSACARTRRVLALLLVLLWLGHGSDLAEEVDLGGLRAAHMHNLAMTA